MLPYIFEPFRRGTANDARAKTSMGLGLYIVRQIVDQHGGQVDVRSSAAHGTTFTVRLPAGCTAEEKVGPLRTAHGV